MRRLVFAAYAIAIVSAPLLAQSPPSPVGGISASDMPKLIPPEQKLRYICKQLELTDEQRQHAEGLFAIMHAETQMTADETRDRLLEVQATYQEMLDARSKGEKEREEQLRAHLKSLAPGKAAERRFVEGLIPALDAKQQTLLKEWTARLENATDISLKPVEILRYVRSMNLSAAQKEKLTGVIQEFRTYVAGPGAQAEEDALLDKLIKDIGAVLDEDQRKTFEREMSKRRPDPAPKPAQASPPTP